VLVISCLYYTYKGSKHVGCNQDALLVDKIVVQSEQYSNICIHYTPLLYAIADGVTNRPAGNIASLTIVNAIRDTYSINNILECIQQTHMDIKQFGMRTTLAGCLIVNDVVHTFSVGDSLILYEHNNTIMQANMKNLKTIGGNEDKLHVHTRKFRLMQGDRLYICSDGVLQHNCIDDTSVISIQVLGEL